MSNLSASTDDLEILYYGEENVPKSNMFGVLNANLTYLCKRTTADLIECYGIGIKIINIFLCS